jgi:hypothetical protein
MFDMDWQKILTDVVLFAGEHPWQFIYYVLLFLSPFFAISAYLAWKLAKEIEVKEKEQKRKDKRKENIMKRKKTE